LTFDKVVASFYVAAWATVLMVAIAYFVSAPEAFDNDGFSKLDHWLVGTVQFWIRTLFSRLFRRPMNPRLSTKTLETLHKAILVLSDQQLITGLAISLVGLARICQISQYHFNTVINLAFAANLAHSLTFSFVEEYVTGNVFFRTWRAVAMLLFGVLLFGMMIVRGGNDWLNWYGAPALCGYQNLGQSFAPPASTCLVLVFNRRMGVRHYYFASQQSKGALDVCPAQHELVARADMRMAPEVNWRICASFLPTV